MRHRHAYTTLVMTDDDVGLFYAVVDGVAARATSADATGVFVKQLDTYTTHGVPDEIIDVEHIAVLRVMGYATVVAGAEISEGDYLASDADGKAVPATTGKVMGRAMAADESGSWSASPGDKVTMLLSPEDLGG